MNGMNDYDIIVVGGGHAGVEAAAAAARAGAATLLLTTNLDTIGQMSCNPAIGGVAKGHVVREIDAMGGLMGQAIDRTGIQFRLLNRRKGPAMQGPRAQADKRAYQLEVRYLLENQSNLRLRQGGVESLMVESVHGRSRVHGVRTQDGEEYRAGAVILTTGTFLSAIMHTGEVQTRGGRAGEGTSGGISHSLRALGLQMERFKTGTPPRIDGKTIDFSKTQVQLGDEPPQPFSFLTDRLRVAQLPCYITHTNTDVHDTIRANLHRSPMYSGQIKAGGPRYCPSIEDKVVRFADKDRHQIFLEPEGARTNEFYINGISTSLPRDVQALILRSIPGLEHSHVLKFGYAVEYDYCPPTQLQPSLECRDVEGLFLAGQINGTTGYEEAAGQGLIAGINAARKLASQPAMILERHQAYLGVLIDDLVTNGVDEPYRLFTSRAEFRLQLRHDNADRRLTPLARTLGLIDEARWSRFSSKQQEIESTLQKLKTVRREGQTLEQWLRRSETTWAELEACCPELRTVGGSTIEQLTNDVRYAGYVERQEVQIARQKRLADKRIPNDLVFEQITQLRFEARQKFTKHRPTNLDQAARISGITPSDIAVLLAVLRRTDLMGDEE